MRAQRVIVIGAGLSGPLLAILLARRGFEVSLYERRGDPRVAASEAGRSINLALAARGIRALELASVMKRVLPLEMTMRGRMVHEPDGATALQPYGQRPDEVIYSVGRTALNRLLIDEAARYPNVSLHFGQRGLEIGPDGTLRLRDEHSGRVYDAQPAPILAADGAGSAIRASLVSAAAVKAREDPLDHDYKELVIPAVEGRHALDPGALHIWPRHGFMLIALPNTDATFTATLFLPREGRRSFASLAGSTAVCKLFDEEFADMVALVPDLLRQFESHPQGRLGTVHVAPWHLRGRALLIGDAAHAIVPFHGQGMNAAFEDCAHLDALLDEHDDWESLFAAFESERRPNTEAIARMAIENYREMRESVLDPKFLQQKAWALELERAYPDRFIPRYSMVMFHPEISYAEALRRGSAQQEILDALYRRTRGREGFDARLAEDMIERI